MLSEEDARRAAELAPTLGATARHWIGQLLDDRRERTAVIQSLARQLDYLRDRLRQASRYLDGLVEAAVLTSQQPWPKKVPCPACGAVVDRLRVEYRPRGAGPPHVLVYEHPDGMSCEYTAQRPSPPT